jgi:serine/threonine protein kinase
VRIFGVCNTRTATFRSYHTQKADLWSLGIFLYRMATAQLTCDGTSDHEIQHQIRQWTRQFPCWIDRDIEPIIRYLTTMDANERPMSTAIVDNHFLDETRFARQAKQTKQTVWSTRTNHEMDLSMCKLLMKFWYTWQCKSHFSQHRMNRQRCESLSILPHSCHFQSLVRTFFHHCVNGTV